MSTPKNNHIMIADIPRLEVEDRLQMASIYGLAEALLGDINFRTIGPPPFYSWKASLKSQQRTEEEKAARKTRRTKARNRKSKRGF